MNNHRPVIGIAGGGPSGRITALKTTIGDFSIERVVQSVERVKERLIRAARALENSGIEYAIAGGNAVAVWISRVDPGAVRNTPDVDVLVRKSDFDGVRAALEREGFVHRHLANDVGGIDVFLDGPDGRPRDAVHLIYANELIRPTELDVNPDVTEVEIAEGAYRVLTLSAIVRIKLTAFRRKDQTHLDDLIEVGLVDESWLTRLPKPLADRLQGLLETRGS